MRRVLARSHSIIGLTRETVALRTDLARAIDKWYAKNRLKVLNGVMHGLVVRWVGSKVQVLQFSNERKWLRDRNMASGESEAETSIA
jgi:hypothetical protein